MRKFLIENIDIINEIYTQILTCFDIIRREHHTILLSIIGKTTENVFGMNSFVSKNQLEETLKIPEFLRDFKFEIEHKLSVRRHKKFVRDRLPEFMSLRRMKMENSLSSILNNFRLQSARNIEKTLTEKNLRAKLMNETKRLPSKEVSYWGFTCVSM